MTNVMRPEGGDGIRKREVRGDETRREGDALANHRIPAFESTDGSPGKTWAGLEGFWIQAGTWDGARSRV